MHSFDDVHPPTVQTPRHTGRVATLWLAVLPLVALALSGCGVDNATLCGGAAVPASSSGSGLAVTPSSTSLTLYPGQTLTLPVAVTAASGAITTVSLGDLPTGLSVAPVQVTGSGTANLTLSSSVLLATECFNGTVNVFTATYPVQVTASSGGNTASDGVLLNVVLQNPSYVPAKVDLPTLSITTTSGQPVVVEDTALAGTVSLVDSANTAYNYTGSMTVKGHGHSTFLAPKTPYDLKLTTTDALLGMGAGKNWVLLANYYDKSMLRDYVASQLGPMFGLPWTPSGQFVELYFNGAYQGTYLLSQKVEIDTHRLNIVEAPSTDVAGADETGGYLLEFNFYQDETLVFDTPHGAIVGVEAPSTPTVNETSYIPGVVDAAENILYSSNYANPTTGWRSQFDENTLINWYLVEELMGNQDGNFYSSDYFYKQIDDPHLYMGPLWDFDISSGNVNYSPVVNPNVPWIRERALWYQQLFLDPSFVADVRARWTAMRTQTGTVPALIDTDAATLTLAAQNNYARWPTLGQEIFPNPEAAGSFQGEVDYLKQWFVKRIAMMDALYLN